MTVFQGNDVQRMDACMIEPARHTRMYKNLNMRTKNQKCHDISLRTLRRAISIHRGHFPDCFFVIPERLVLIRVVVFAFTANKETNKHSQLYIYIDEHPLLDIKLCIQRLHAEVLAHFTPALLELGQHSLLNKQTI